MKLIRIGYPGSDKIKLASRYLVNKYLPGFDYIELNYEGPIEKWSEYIISCLKAIDDPIIIFGLDDYLLNDRLNKKFFDFAVLKLQSDECINVKLCDCTPSEQIEYPVTTQFTLWKRDKLIEVLEQTTTPWSFEIQGSKYVNRKRYMTAQIPALKYYTNSSLSSRWEGIRLDGLNEQDIKEIQTLI